MKRTKTTNFMRKLSITLLVLFLFGCSVEKKVSKANNKKNITIGTTFPPEMYNAYNILKRPPSEYSYRLSSYNPQDSVRALKPKYSLDSVLYISITSKIGRRYPDDSPKGGIYFYLEDLNDCKNLGFLEVEKNGEISPELDFSNFPELRYLELHSSKIITEKQQYDLLNTAKKLRGLSFGSRYPLPECICELKDLEYLELINYSRSDLPSCISDLPNLKYLQIGGVNPKSVPTIFSNENLEFLSVNGGDSLNIPESIHRLKKLRHLEISYFNTLQLPSMFEELDALELLEIGWINDTISIHKEITGLRNLKGVRFVNMNLKKIPEFKGCANLEYLYFYGIDYLKNTDLNFEPVKNTLACIELHGKAFSEIHAVPSGLDQASNLRFMHFYGLPIKTIPRTFQNLKQLESILLYGSELDFESVLFIYDTLHKQGLKYFNPPLIGVSTEEQRDTLQRLDFEGGRGMLMSHSKPSISYFSNAFEYYKKRIKFGLETEWDPYH